MSKSKKWKRRFKALEADVKNAHERINIQIERRIREAHPEWFKNQISAGRIDGYELMFVTIHAPMIAAKSIGEGSPQ